MAKARAFPPSDNEPIIDYVVEQFQQYLHLPNPTPIYVVLGAVAANMLYGPPVYVMLIGSTGCGKTTLINSLKHIDRVFSLGQCKNSAAFLTSGRKGGTGGLLREIGEELPALITIKDFSAMLSVSQDQLTEVMDVFRGMYDCEYERNTGHDGGDKLSWCGKAGIIAGVTPSIDINHRLSADLGERWLYYRMFTDLADGEVAAKKALSEQKDLRQMGEDLKTAASLPFLEKGMYWGMDRQMPDDVPHLSEKEEHLITDYGAAACKMRTAVVRDRYSKEITEQISFEAPMRIAGAMHQMFVGMRYIGVGLTAAWQVIKSIALHSAPGNRLHVIKAIDGAYWAGIDATSSLIKSQVSFSMGTVNRALEELELLQCIERKKDTNGFNWSMKPEMRKLFE